MSASEETLRIAIGCCRNRKRTRHSISEEEGRAGLAKVVLDQPFECGGPRGHEFLRELPRRHTSRLKDGVRPSNHASLTYLTSKALAAANVGRGPLTGCSNCTTKSSDRITGIVVEGRWVVLM